MIGAVTAGWCSSQASAPCAGGTPRVPASAITLSTTLSSSALLYMSLLYWSLRERTVSARRLPASMPRASGLQGMTPTPSAAQSGSISRSSSR